MTKEAKDDDEDKEENDDYNWPNLPPVSSTVPGVVSDRNNTLRGTRLGVCIGYTLVSPLLLLLLLWLWWGHNN